MKKINNQFIIESSRLFLRAILFDDYLELMKFHNNANVMRFIGNGKHDWTVEEFDAEIKNHTKDYDNGYGFWTTVEKESGRICGKCGIIEHIREDKTSEVELGYLFGNEFWGRGYATEISLAIVKYFFCELKKEQLVAYTFLENSSSVKVLNKIGMVKEYQFNAKGHQIVRFTINRNSYYSDKVTDED
ncbi:MAG: GNAT family N-acetyltransferase [Oligoflexia bacterium]|nr:GNAT family N-acetyltransferase [Oligoflexia bacterium]